MEKQGLKALIYGCTGAVGSQVVSLLLSSPKWSTVHCIARKQPEEWNGLPGKQKLIMEVSQNLDDYFKQQNNHYGGYDTVFSCFGTQVKMGQQTFIKVDKTYPLLAADIALKNKIPHYILVSSTGSNPNSWFLYMKTKGEVERDLKAKHMNLLTILKPGLIKNRKNARTAQKIFGIFPFGPSIQCKQVAQVCRIVAEKERDLAKNSNESVKVLQNKDMLNVLTF